MSCKPGAARDLAPSDTRNDAGFSWLMVVGTTGSVVLGLDETGGERTLAIVPVGVWIPVNNATHIKTSSTAVGFMVA